MEYKYLGNTNIKVSKIGLGTMTWGEQNTEAEAHNQLEYAISKGINFIDTAEMYPIPRRAETQGRTESYIGTWLKASGHRINLVLATKVAGPAPDLKYIRQGPDFSPIQLRSALEGSLKRLQTDYIDLYQLHWPERNTNSFGKRGFTYDPDDSWTDNILEVLQQMEQFRNEGKIRFFGVSNETPWGVARFLQLAKEHNLPRVQSIQNPYNLLNRTYEIGLAEISIREKCGLLAYSPLAFGWLSGKYYPDTAPEGSRVHLFPQLKRYHGLQTQKAIKKYVELARSVGFSPAQMALAFVNDQPFLTSNLIGATSLDQLKENISSVNMLLPEEIKSEIAKIHEEIPDPAP
jgi:aryl-alcohol dehydrogenase-like predicted oxidoreductase